MPGVRDKIIINSGGLAAGDCAVDGNADALQEQFNTAGLIAAEIEKAGLLWHADVIGFKTEVETLCKKLDDAQDSYSKCQNDGRLKLRALTDKMRVWLDGQLHNQQVP